MHSARKVVCEQITTVRRSTKGVQIIAFHQYFIEDASKKLGVFAFLPQKRCQEQLFLQAAFPRHRHDKWQEIQSDSFFTSLKSQNKATQALLVLPGDLLPVLAIPSEINVTWVPRPQLFRFVIEPHWQNL